MLGITQELTMAIAVTQQSTENMEYVRLLLKHKQPGFSAALELACDPAAPTALADSLRTFT
jgi:hypothetical protein